MAETIHLQLLLATFAAWVARKQANIIAYLMEENRILKNSSRLTARESDSRMTNGEDSQPRQGSSVGRL